MDVEVARISDIASLTELRLTYLKEDYGQLSEETITKLRKDLPSYFKNHLNRDIFCYLIRENDKVVACAFLLVVEKPSSPMFLSGKTGSVLNVYTNPAYRRRGYAKRIMEKLLSDAISLNLSVVELKATADGYHLYKSVGFTEDTSGYRHMKWCNKYILPL